MSLGGSSPRLVPASVADCLLVAVDGISLLVHLDNRILCAWRQGLGRFVSSPLKKLEGSLAVTQTHAVCSVRSGPRNLGDRGTDTHM